MSEFSDPKRSGFHYYPDTDHYTLNDLNHCLPGLKNLQAGWLVLKSETSRAIPEQFISGLVKNSINPIIHFPFELPDAPAAADIKAILQAYASWGVKYVVLFDSPNSRASWSKSGWSQTNLVESFIDRFIPLANECIAAGLNVVFPPLEPGGNYWDLSFLHSSLLSLQRRNQNNLIAHLSLSAYARTYGHPADWGKGGPEKWSGNKPYVTPADSQDQIGFWNFEWLQNTARSTCNRSFPMILLGVGQKTSDPADALSLAEQKDVIQSLNSILVPSEPESFGSSEIIAANIWLLCAGENDSAYSSAWLKADGTLAPIVSSFQKSPEKTPTFPKAEAIQESIFTDTPSSTHPIKHYLLLPAYEWGVADWHLDVIKPFVRKHQPTIGFSLAEAALAETVTVIGGEQSFSEEALTELRSQGCQVERIAGDGTSIATQLAER